MTIEIEVGGQTRTVEITRVSGAGFAVTIDGRQHTADVTRIGSTWSLLLGPARAGPYEPKGSYEISIVEQVSGDLEVYVDGRPVRASVVAGGHNTLRGWRHDAGLRRTGAATGESASHGPQRITAPMPGRIVKVLVKAGDTIAARQGLVIVEAMKMENELRSTRAGTVREVRVAEGMSVEANAVLVVVE